MLLAAIPAAAQSSSTQSAAAAPPRLAFDERVDDPPVLAPAVRALGTRAGDLPLLVRIVVGRAALGPFGATADLRALDERIRLYGDLNVRVLVALEDLPAAEAEVDAWRQLVRTIAERFAGKVFGYQVGLRLSAADADSARSYAYYLKLASVQVRSVDSQARVLHAAASGDNRDWHAAVYREDVAAYSDGVVVRGAAAEMPASPDIAPGFQTIRSLVAEADPDALMILAGLVLDEAAGQWLPTQFSVAGEHPI